MPMKRKKVSSKKLIERAIELMREAKREIAFDFKVMEAYNRDVEVADDEVLIVCKKCRVGGIIVKLKDLHLLKVNFPEGFKCNYCNRISPW